MQLEPGSQFAGYRIDGVAGRGGMGVVYRATELALDRPVALKLIKPELAGDPEFRERFVRESRLAASIDHPGILPVYAVGEADGEVYLATRFVEGTDLKRVLDQRGVLPVPEALDVGRRVAAALDVAHAKGLVHRDVKPANVLVDPTGHCYLTDFGLTKQTGSTSTASGVMVGTLDYLAPEQIRGDPVDAPADQYALAILLYECLAGSSPFRRRSDAQTLWAHMQEAPPSVRDTRPELPAALDATLARALAKEPGDRFPSCTAFLDDALAGTAGDAPPSRPPRRRRLNARIVIGAILILVLIFLITVGAAVLDDDAPLTAGANTVAAVDPASGDVVAVIAVGDTPTEITTGDGAVWVVNSNEGAGTISRIDAATKTVTTTFSVAGTPRTVAYVDGALWVGTVEGNVVQVDPTSGVTDRTFRLRNAGRSSAFGFDVGPGWLTSGGGAVWASSFRTITRIELRTLDQRPSTTSAYARLAFGFGSVWALGEFGLERYAPSTMKRIARVPVLVGDLPFAAGAGAVWVPDDTGSTVWRVDPRRNAVARTIDISGRPTGVAVGGGFAWAAVDDGTLVRIDPASNATTVFAVGGRPRSVAVGSGLVWVTVD